MSEALIPVEQQRTLYGDIFDWLLTPLLLVLWPTGLFVTWLVAQGLAHKPYDKALESNAYAIAQLVQVKGHIATLALPRPAQDILRADETDEVFYQVLGTEGEHLGGDKDFPTPPEFDNADSGTLKLRNDEMRGKRIRVAYIWVLATGANDYSQRVLVQVGETMEKRAHLATEMVKGVILPQFIAVPLTVLLVWVGLSYALRPLSQLEKRVRQRQPEDLSPLDTSSMPQEIAPLVGSVNDLLLRLQGSMETQKRFLTDAAHQLKTPLAGLRMQADLALREGGDETALKHSLKQIAHSSVRATHTVNQLLALARAEAAGEAVSLSNVDIRAIALSVVQDCVPHALEKNIDLGFECEHDDAVIVQGNATLLKEMTRNLLDNAIHYTPERGIVTLRVLLLKDDAPETPSFEQRIVLQVEDNGPGIPAAERELVFQPFYRALGTHVDGSGLGLSIVRQIVDKHHARLSLEETKPGQAQPGACFSVHFQPH